MRAAGIACCGEKRQAGARPAREKELLRGLVRSSCFRGSVVGLFGFLFLRGLVRLRSFVRGRAGLGLARHTFLGRRRVLSKYESG